jgi:hypothetical protein
MGLMGPTSIQGFALFPLLNLALEQKYGKKKGTVLLPTARFPEETGINPVEIFPQPAF